MPPKNKPEVIELDRYRKAAEQRAHEAAAKAKAARRPERFLGSRRNAGWLLLLVLLLVAALFIAPLFLHF
jgi:hypothetical protein